jgi:hypothetical protein
MDFYTALVERMVNELQEMFPEDSNFCYPE